MNRFTLSFTLKQHTPIIHFQHHHKGANLRATELRPKLDAFLLAKLGKSGIKDDWIVKKKKKENNELTISLDYKISIEPEGELFYEMIEKPKKVLSLDPPDYERNKKGEVKLASFPGFFGNLGLDMEKQSLQMKHFVLHEKVKITFFSFHGTLLEEIKAHFPWFMALHNFGSRQSKGFGSYYLEDLEKYPIGDYFTYRFIINTSSFELERCEWMVKNRTASDKYVVFYKLFYALNLFYSSLRSGLNIEGLYFKSLMFMYAKEKGIQWDKKTIRDKFQFDTRVYKKAKKRYGSISGGTFSFFKREKRLMRDMLGLSSEQFWMAYRDVIKKECGQIERFKSPITFKIIQLDKSCFEVFIYPQQIHELMFDALFSITSKNSQEELELKTPTREQFNLMDFLDFCFHRAFPTSQDFCKHVGRSSVQELTQEALILFEIYDQLRSC